jgi:predicted aspartyl protease
MPQRTHTIALRLAYIVWLTFCLTTSARQALAQSHPTQSHPIYTTTFDSDDHGTIYLPVQVNATIPARFFFDTGSLTFLSDEFVRKHRLKTHPILRADGKPAQFENGVNASATTVTITIPHTALTFRRETLVLSADIIHRMSVDCDGILGADSLTNMAVLINLIGHRLSFLPGGNVDAATRRQLSVDGDMAPLKVNNTLLLEVAVSYGDVTNVPMLIDSGSEFTKVPGDLAKKIKTHWQDGGHIAVATGEFAIYSAQLDTMQLGSLLVRGQRVVYTDGPSGPVANPLGRDFLRRMITLIDVPARKLYVRDLQLGEGPNPLTRRLLGEQGLIPPHTVYFPYGGQTGDGDAVQRYVPRAGAMLTPGYPLERYKIVQNQPPANAPHAPAEIDIQTNQGAMIVPAQIEGKPAHLLLDLGSIVTWLTPDAAARLELKTRLFEEFGTRITIAGFNPLRLAASAPEFESGFLQAYIDDKPTLYRLSPTAITGTDGVLGLDYLATQVIGVDLAQHKLLLWPWASTESDRIGWLSGGKQANAAHIVTLDLEHEQDDWLYVDALVNGQRLKMALDTADSVGCALPDSMRAGGAATAPASGAAFTAAIDLDGLTLPAVPVTYVPELGLQAIPRLGLSWLAGHRVILDLPRHHILISRP